MWLAKVGIKCLRENWERTLRRCSAKTSGGTRVLRTACLPWSPLATALAVLREIMHNDGHRAVQGHSRSQTFVPFESSHAFAIYYFSE